MAGKMNRHEVRQMLEAGRSTGSIAREIGVTSSAVSQMKKRLIASGELGGPKLAAPPRARAKTAPVEIPDLPGPYTVAQDAAIIRTEGAYKKLHRLAEKWGKPSQSVIQRWHRLRGGR